MLSHSIYLPVAESISTLLTWDPWTDAAKGALSDTTDEGERISTFGPFGPLGALGAFELENCYLFGPTCKH